MTSGVAVQLDLFAFVAIQLSLLGAVVGAFWKIASSLMERLVVNYDEKLEQRFQYQETLRAEGMRHWEERFERIDVRQSRQEHELTNLKNDLPREFWRREDAIREAAIINAKVDSVNAKIEQLLMMIAKGPGK